MLGIKNEGAYRIVVGMGEEGRARYVTLDLTTRGRERESSARIINGMKKKKRKEEEKKRTLERHGGF